MTTPKRPSCSAFFMYCRAVSSLDWPALKWTTGIPLRWAKRWIARTYASPILPNNAGEGIWQPRSSKNRTSIPSDWSFGI
ncbi:MAG: hypothetical protein ACXVGQ_13335 [Mycobacteriaceae bacterium]